MTTALEGVGRRRRRRRQKWTPKKSTTALRIYDNKSNAEETFAGRCFCCCERTAARLRDKKDNNTDTNIITPMNNNKSQDTLSRKTSFSTALISLLYFLLFASFPLSSAGVIDVQVGYRNERLELLFTPEVIRQEVGQQVRFQFFPQNHSVAQSSLESPCTPLGGPESSAGFFSGFREADGNDQQYPTFTINVSSSEPIYFYCALGRHCQNGMVGVINPPNSDTINVFKAAAAKEPTTQVPLRTSHDLPSADFPTSRAVSMSTTSAQDPQYTPNTPAPSANATQGLSTSGYIAVAGVGLLIVAVIALTSWCIVLRRRKRREREARRTAHLERERRRQRGNQNPSRDARRPYRDDVERGVVDMESLQGYGSSPRSHAHSYNYRPPPVAPALAHRNSSLVAQISHSSYISPNSMNTRSPTPGYSVNLAPSESNEGGYVYSINQVKRLSLTRSPTRLSLQQAPVPYRQDRQMQTPSQQSNSSNSIQQSRPGTSNQTHTHSTLRKPSPVQQALYEERRQPSRTTPTPSQTTRTTPTPPIAQERKWKIFRKSTYQRRMEVREIDIHDVNRHKTTSTRKPTPSSSFVIAAALERAGSPLTDINRNISTSTGVASTVIDAHERRQTALTDNSKEMRGGGSVVG